VLQYPVGWLSDRIDRRQLILWLAVVAAAVLGVAAAVDLPFRALLAVAAILGGITYPMYSLLIAYTNDFLAHEQMAAAAAGMIFLNGFGAVFGPLVTGWLMGEVGPRGFFLFMAVLYAVQAVYAAWRMTQRAAPANSAGWRGVTPTASTVAVGAVMAQPPRGQAPVASEGRT
jgi:MFS family permease